MRELGMLLDRAVHLTFTRFAGVIPVFILADALGGLLQPAWLPGPGGYIALMLAGMILENRARVVAIASRDAGKRGSAAWGAALRHPAALVYAVVAMVEGSIWYQLLLIGGFIFVLVSLPATQAGVPWFAYVIVLVVGLTVALLLLAASLLITLAGVAATFDTVIERTPPHRALWWWLRETFRMRSLGTTLPAAAIVAVLVAGLPLVLGLLIRWGPSELRAVLFAIPEGIADAIALVFVWRWRDAFLERRHGHDIQALLDASAQSPRTVSPSATSPGVTTSQ